MTVIKRKIILLICMGMMLMTAVSPLNFRCAVSAQAASWATAAEAEAARAEAEAKARALAQEMARLNTAAAEAEEAAEEAEELLAKAEEALEAARKKGDADVIGKAEAALEVAAEEVERKNMAAEAARTAVEAANQDLIAAAMVLKEATEASVQMANTELIDDSRISATFSLGERYNGTFNKQRDPIYIRFLMDRDARVKISTKEAKVSISVLDDTGTTILTLVPSTNGKGSVCSLTEGEYTMMIAAMGTGKNVSISVTEEKSALEEEEEEFFFDDDETEMETLVEFD